MSLVSVGNVLIDREVLLAEFACDLEHCRGACCVEGELGAPLTPSEAMQLQALPETVVRMLPEKSVRYLRRHGAVEIYQGAPYTRTIEGRECVYACSRGGITFCAIEAGFREGLSDFDKPISCRLFPVRVRRKFGLDHLVYQQLPICRSARKLGGERRTKLVDYIGKALESAYGTEWVSSLKAFLDSSPIS
ncbi:MAG: DUF3109 family protein [Chlorobi bacterium]|nr:DUF3109 family protein [Chlorobiota bacterium]